MSIIPCSCCGKPKGITLPDMKSIKLYNLLNIEKLDIFNNNLYEFKGLG